MVILIAIVIIVVIYVVIVSASKKKHKSEKQYVLENIENFTMDEVFISCDGKSAIAVDKTTKEICYVDNMNIPTIYLQSEILESEILEDSQSVSKQSASRTIGGFMVGGFIGGGAGSIVGGLSGRRTSFSQVKQIKLKIRVNDLNTPALTLLFMDELTHVKTTGFQGKLYRDASGKANHWQDILSVLIKSADKEFQEKTLKGQSNIVEAVNNSNPNKLPANNNLLADELSKLHSLKEKGILTEVEFNIQKIKLLNN